MTEIRLGDEDIQCLIALDDFTFLDSGLIGGRIFASEHNVNRKLNYLVEGGYIKDFTSLISMKTKPKKVYCLTKKGAEVVEEIQGYTNYKPIRQLPVTYLHTLEVARAIMSFRDSKGMQLKEFVNERNAYFEFGAGAKDSIRPDGMFVIGFEDSDDENIGVLLEIEKTKTKRSVIKEKMKKYKAFFNDVDIRDRYIDHLSIYDEINDWILLYVASTEEIEKYTKGLLLRQKPNDGQTTNDRPGINFPTLLTNMSLVEEDPYKSIYYAMEQDDTNTRNYIDEYL